jgi:hypothetical protein
MEPVGFGAKHRKRADVNARLQEAYDVLYEALDHSSKGAYQKIWEALKNIREAQELERRDRNFVGR